MPSPSRPRLARRLGLRAAGAPPGRPPAALGCGWSRRTSSPRSGRVSRVTRPDRARRRLPLCVLPQPARARSWQPYPARPPRLAKLCPTARWSANCWIASQSARARLALPRLPRAMAPHRYPLVWTRKQCPTSPCLASLAESCPGYRSLYPAWHHDGALWYGNPPCANLSRE